MKKSIFLVTMIWCSTFMVSGQEQTSKSGFPYTPQAGDYAISIDAAPILNFIGDLIKINNGNNFNNPAAWNFVDGSRAIYGKYYLTNELAARANIRFQSDRQTLKNLVKQDGSNDPLARVEDKAVFGNHLYILGAGLEKHRTHGRLSGFYGAEVQLIKGGGKESFEYGNGFNDSTLTPTTTNFNSMTAGPVTSRIKETRQSPSFGFGARAFAGIEYFIAPRISVGGEFGWAIGYTIEGESEVTIELWDYTEEQTKSITTKTAGASHFGFDNDNFGGLINITFHF